MEAFVIIAIVGFGLLLAELLLPTGGVLALHRDRRPGRRPGSSPSTRAPTTTT